MSVIAGVILWKLNSELSSRFIFVERFSCGLDILAQDMIILLNVYPDSYLSLSYLSVFSYEYYRLIGFLLLVRANFIKLLCQTNFFNA